MPLPGRPVPAAGLPALPQPGSALPQSGPMMALEQNSVARVVETSRAPQTRPREHTPGALLELASSDLEQLPPGSDTAAAPTWLQKGTTMLRTLFGQDYSSPFAPFSCGWRRVISRYFPTTSELRIRAGTLPVKVKVFVGEIEKAWPSRSFGNYKRSLPDFGGVTGSKYRSRVAIGGSANTGAGQYAQHALPRLLHPAAAEPNLLIHASPLKNPAALWRSQFALYFPRRRSAATLVRYSLRTVSRYETPPERRMKKRPGFLNKKDKAGLLSTAHGRQSLRLFSSLRRVVNLICEAGELPCVPSRSVRTLLSGSSDLTASGCAQPSHSVSGNVEPRSPAAPPILPANFGSRSPRSRSAVYAALDRATLAFPRKLTRTTSQQQEART